MSQELIYTSVPRGLKPGSKGFCTVAQTADLPAALAERLESLSGYRPLFPLGDASVSKNPVNWAHWRVNFGGRTRSVLSRVAFAGVDYSQRSNKFAHHLVLDSNEQPAAGPAWVMLQPGVMQSSWRHDPSVLTAGPPIPQGDRAFRPCDSWKAVSGDAGWAGVLAEQFHADPAKPAYLIFSPGTDLLPLIDEALSLLPLDKRWQVTFSTYFTDLPAGLSCAWRCVAAGTAAAKDAKRSAGPVIDLTNGSLGEAPDSPLVSAARTAEPPKMTADSAGARVAVVSPETRGRPTPSPGEATQDLAALRRRRNLNDQPLELVEEPETPGYSYGASGPVAVARKSSAKIWLAACASLLIGLLLGAPAGHFLWPQRRTQSVPVPNAASDSKAPALPVVSHDRKANVVIPVNSASDESGSGTPRRTATNAIAATEKSSGKASASNLNATAVTPQIPAPRATGGPTTATPAVDSIPASSTSLVEPKPVDALKRPMDAAAVLKPQVIDFASPRTVDSIELHFPNDKTEFALGGERKLEARPAGRSLGSIEIHIKMKNSGGFGQKEINYVLATFDLEEGGKLTFNWAPFDRRPPKSEEIVEPIWEILQRSVVSGLHNRSRVVAVTFSNNPISGEITASKPWDLSLPAPGLVKCVLANFPAIAEPAAWKRTMPSDGYQANYERASNVEPPCPPTVSFSVTVIGSGSGHEEPPRLRFQTNWNEEKWLKKYNDASALVNSAEKSDPRVIELNKRIATAKDDNMKKKPTEEKDKRIAEIVGERDRWGRYLDAMEDIGEFKIPLQFGNGVTLGTITVPTPKKGVRN